MTPPALARMSGTTGMPRALNTKSASGQVGLLAASMISLAPTAWASSLSKTPPRAVGIRTSTGDLKSWSLVAGSPPLNPTILIDQGMIAQPSFVRPARIVMLDPVADKIADRSRIELDDDLDPDLALGGDQEGPNVLGEAKQLGGLVKIKAGGLEGLHRQVNPRITDQWESATAGDTCPRS